MSLFTVDNFRKTRKIVSDKEISTYFIKIILCQTYELVTKSLNLKILKEFFRSEQNVFSVLIMKFDSFFLYFVGAGSL
jgi:hypothetical protein